MSASLEELMKQIPNRYQLVLAAARRANDLALGAQSTAGESKKKIATIALDEIALGKVHYEIKKDTKKEKSSA